MFIQCKVIQNTYGTLLLIKCKQHFKSLIIKTDSTKVLISISKTIFCQYETKLSYKTSCSHILLCCYLALPELTKFSTHSYQSEGGKRHQFEKSQCGAAGCRGCAGRLAKELQIQEAPNLGSSRSRGRRSCTDRGRWPPG